MKTYDLTNRTFGRWTALYKSKYKKGNHYPWHCICKCGTERDVNTRDLISGKSCSCGCLQKEIASEIGKKTIKFAKQVQFKDLSNQKFGKLTAIEGIYINEKYKWKCRCDCGNVVYINTHDLISGNTSSCGCLKSKGQEKIAQILNEYNISFVTEKIFKDCVYTDTKYNCRFDFYVNNNYLIEYDGIQHFKDNSFFPLSLKEQQLKDEFKNQYCIKHNIPLIRIPYTKFNTLIFEDLNPETSDFIINK